MAGFVGNLEQLHQKLRTVDQEKSDLDREVERTLLRSHFRCGDLLGANCEHNCTPRCAQLCNHIKLNALHFNILQYQSLSKRREQIMKDIYIIQNLEEIIERSVQDLTKEDINGHQ